MAVLRFNKQSTPSLTGLVKQLKNDVSYKICRDVDNDRLELGSRINFNVSAEIFVKSLCHIQKVFILEGRRVCVARKKTF